MYADHQANSPYVLTGTDYVGAVALWLLLLIHIPPSRIFSIILDRPQTCLFLVSHASLHFTDCHGGIQDCRLSLANPEQS